MTFTEAKTTEEMIIKSQSILNCKEDVKEIRIMQKSKGTISGYFNDYQKLASVAAEFDGKVPAIYFTLNPVKPDLLSRAANRIVQRAKIRLLMPTLNADDGFQLILTQYVRLVFHQRMKNIVAHTLAKKYNNFLQIEVGVNLL